MNIKITNRGLNFVYLAVSVGVLVFSSMGHTQTEEGKNQVFYTDTGQVETSGEDGVDGNTNPGDSDLDTDTDPVDTDTDPVDTDADPVGTDADPVGTDADPVDTDTDPVDTDDNSSTVDQVESENAKSFYETAPNIAAMKAERIRLKGIRKDLKKDKKALRKEIREIENRIDDLEKEIKKHEKAGESDLISKKKNQLDKLTTTFEQKDDELEKKKDVLSENRKLIVGTRNVRFTPFVSPSYTPELGFMITGGGLLTFKTNRRDEYIQRSSTPVFFGYSSSGAIVGNLNLNSYWLKDWLRANTLFWIKDMPDNYWGVGYEAGSAHEDPNDDTKYQRLWWQVKQEILVKMGVDSLYGGLVLDFNQTIGTEMSDAMEVDADIQEFGSDNYNGGSGIVVMYDSRDVPVNAYTGLLAKASATFYGKYFGGDNTYQIYDVDYRQYVTIGRPGSTLAWQMKARFGGGDVPWGELSQLGSPFEFRGYRWGRYRDKYMVFGVLEYRFMFKEVDLRQTDGFLSNQGLVAWGGVGSIGAKFRDMTNWLPNWGFGYRLELQSRMNLRVDVGFGNDCHAIYFNFNEAF